VLEIAIHPARRHRDARGGGGSGPAVRGGRVYGAALSPCPGVVRRPRTCRGRARARARGSDGPRVAGVSLQAPAPRGEAVRADAGAAWGGGNGTVAAGRDVVTCVRRRRAAAGLSAGPHTAAPTEGDPAVCWRSKAGGGGVDPVTLPRWLSEGPHRASTSRTQPAADSGVLASPSVVNDRPACVVQGTSPSRWRSILAQEAPESCFSPGPGPQPRLPGRALSSRPQLITRTGAKPQNPRLLRPP
jgi:hypothetical protein